MKDTETRNPESPVDLLVVGGGIAGLSAAAFAAKAGLSVRLLEKQERLGGLVNSFEREGFTWDGGLRGIEDSGILLPMLASLGIELPLVRGLVSIGVENRFVPVESAENLADYEALLIGLYPGHEKDVRAIVADIRKVMRHMEVLYGVENPAFKDLLHDREYLFKTLLPWLWRFLFTIGAINRMQEPVERHLARFTSHRPLIDIIAQHFFRRTPAFFAMSYFSLYLDYRYPLGGTGALGRAMTDYCSGAGTEFLLSTSARAVDPSAHRLVDSTGREHRYRSLIWAADLKTLYRSVDDEILPEGGWGRRTRERRAFLEPMPGGDSVFSLYLATSRPPAYFAAISNGHLFYSPSKEGIGASLLPDLDALLSEAHAFTDERLKPAVLTWLDRYLSKTTYEISIPVLKDPALAPPGKTGLIVSVLFDFRLTELARERGWYEELKSEIEVRMIAALSTSAYPGLDASILHRFSISPSSLARYTGGADGAITGWAFGEGPRPAPHKMQEVGRSILTTMPEIFQAGQWTYSPAGLPISILTGKLAADAAVKLVSRRRAK